MTDNSGASYGPTDVAFIGNTLYVLIEMGGCSHALPDDRKRATEVGFTSYLAKPIEPNAVVAEVRRLIGGGDGPRAKSGD